MREYVQETDTVTVRRERLVDMHCNKCGRRCPTDGAFRSNWVSVHMDHTHGFGSSNDGHNVKWDLCEPCHEAYMKTFRIPATITFADWCVHKYHAAHPYEPEAEGRAQAAEERFRDESLRQTEVPTSRRREEA